MSENLINEYNQKVKIFYEMKQKPCVKYVENPHILTLIGDVTGKSVLDLGCGNGLHLQQLSKCNPSLLIGIDMSEGQLKYCKDMLPDSVILKQADASQTITLEEKFDIVHSNWLINHMHNFKELKTYLLNIYNLLSEGGKALVFQGDFKIYHDYNLLEDFTVVPTGDWHDGMKMFNKFGDLTLYDHYWTSDTIMRLMSEIGFKNVERIDLYLVHDEAREFCELYNKLKANYTIRAFK